MAKSAQHKMESSPPAYVLDNPYFFCENGNDTSWKEVGEQIAKALYKRGKIPESTAKEVPGSLYGDLYVSDVISPQ